MATYIGSRKELTQLIKDFDELIETIDFLERLTDTDMEQRSIHELLGSATSELGELAEEIAIEEKSFGQTYKESKEGSKAEAVDLAICAIAIHYARGGTFKDFISTMKKKLKKWETNQTFAEKKKKFTAKKKKAVSKKSGRKVYKATPKKK